MGSKLRTPEPIVCGEVLWHVAHVGAKALLVVGQQIPGFLPLQGVPVGGVRRVVSGRQPPASGVLGQFLSMPDPWPNFQVESVLRKQRIRPCPGGALANSPAIYLLTSAATEEEIHQFREHERTGRVLGDGGYQKRLEKKLGRVLRRQRPAPRNLQATNYVWRPRRSRRGRIAPAARHVLSTPQQRARATHTQHNASHALRKASGRATRRAQAQPSPTALQSRW